MATMADLYYVTLVADSQTPSELASHAGTKVGLDPAVTPPETLRQATDLYGVPGTAVRSSAGEWTWLIGPTQDVLLRTVTQLTTWRDLERRRVWRNAFRMMRENGVPTPLLQQAAIDMWAAAQTEVLAQQTPPVV